MADAGDVDQGAGQGFTVGGGGAEGEERQGNEFTELELQNWVSRRYVNTKKEGGKIPPSSPPPQQVGVMWGVMGDVTSFNECKSKGCFWFQ